MYIVGVRCSCRVPQVTFLVWTVKVRY